MQDILTIKKDPGVKDSQNYDLLKEVGLRHIEKLASDLWTDYNEHDPGVTLLEVLAYAITDLGYRTGSDIKDILTAKSDAYKNHQDTFHKATKILPCNQVTELDLREILIDIKGVRNAWIKIAQQFEDTYFVDYDKSVLSLYDPTSSTKEEIIHLNGLYHIVIEFDRLVIPIDLPIAERKVKENKVLHQASARLMQYRNFCEDYFVGIRKQAPSNVPVTKVVTKPIGFEKIVVWADVEVTPDSDMEKVHAQIYFDIEQFLVPYITFYSLQERLSQQKTIDEIFEGPLLEHGFINEDELDEIELREAIHVSDLYQVVMDVPGVKGVKSIKIANYLSANGVTPDSNVTIEEPAGTFNLKKLLQTRGEEWCLNLHSDASACIFYELVLDTVTNTASAPINKTIKFYTGENSVPVTLDTSRTLNELNILRQNDRKRRERLGQLSFELEIPEGSYLDLNDYYPAQNELPAVYGTGQAGLADEASNERKGQAKQLKGYMLFFEQLLSNYLAQLNNVRYLFSWDDTIDKTYYSQLLENIKDRGNLYLEEYESLPLSPNGVLNETRLKELIQADTESPEVFFDRRSRFLNHLISRFNEQFVEYSLIMHSLELEDQLIPHKAKFLKEYDQISRNRGRGFDFSLMRNAIDNTNPNPLLVPDVWDTLNVTGYQHRVCRFLGLSDQSRRFLYSGHTMKIEMHDVAGTINYRYILTISEGSDLQVFGDLFLDYNDALAQFENLIEVMGKESATEILTEIPVSGFMFSLEDGLSNPLGSSGFYPTSSERDDVLDEVNAYFQETTGFLTSVVLDSGTGLWSFTVEVSSANPPFNINGVDEPTQAAAELALQDFLEAVKADSLSFAPISPGSVSNNEFFFEVFSGLQLVGYSDHEIFGGSEALMLLGMVEAENFFDDNVGYRLDEGGLHVVEHILLRPKHDLYALFGVDVKQYDSIETVENPPVAYPVDYDGKYNLNEYGKQYFLSSEVELTSENFKIQINPTILNTNGEKVNIIEPFFYTLSEKQYAETSPINWVTFLTALRNGDPAKFQFTPVPSDSVDAELWFQLTEKGFGCKYANYTFGTIEISETTFNYYFIMDGDVVLGGLASAVLSSQEVKERALRAFAYFCDNTTCKGIANPYEFKATVILPAWTKRARDYNFRAHAEEIIRLEAPAHVAIDIKWVNRSQMKAFEICYREWLEKQAEYLYMDLELLQGGVDPVQPAAIGADGTPYSWLGGDTTRMSNQFMSMVESANCLIGKIDSLVNVYQSIYKSVIRNNQYFTNAPSTIGYKIAWLGASADGSVVNKAEIVGGLLPDFLAFFDGENFISSAGVGSPGDGIIPGTLNPLSYSAGDFVVINYATVVAHSWNFSVKTYSDTGQVSCTTVTITIIQDIEAKYSNTPKCYSHYQSGEIVSEIHDPNGLVISASIVSGTLPPSLKLITDHTDLASWAADFGFDSSLYQPGDIVVDPIMGDPTNHNLDHPINDNLALPSEGNVNLNLTVQIIDITGGITVFTASPNVLNTGDAPGYVPMVIYGNAGLIKNPESCTPRHIATFNIQNVVYPTPSDLLYTFSDQREPNGVTISSASIVTETNSGVSVRVVNGRAEIFVSDFALFEAYIESLPTNLAGIVTFPILDLQVIDTCGFTSQWSGTYCVELDKEAIAEPVITTCAGKYDNNPIIVSVKDVNNGIHSFSLHPTVVADLSALGISYQIAQPSKELVFSVSNGTSFLNAIETETIFNGSEVVNGVEVNTYSFTVDTIDKMGGESSVNVLLYAPANGPLECIKTYPDGTSYLAYLTMSSVWNSKIGYTESTQKVGKTVMTFSDPNGISSINFSCKKCNGDPFPTGIGSGSNWWTNGVLNEAVTNPTKFGENISQFTNFSNAEEPTVNSAKSAKKAAIGGKKATTNPNVSEFSWKMNSNAELTQEKYVKNDLYFNGKVQYDPNDKKPIGENCLEKIGLSLDTVGNRIYVSDSKKFIKNGIGTHKFSVIVVDKCGILTCKEVTLIIGDDKDAYYVDVKNKSYLNSLKSDDVIGYPQDPDGAITKAQIVIYNPATEVMAMPHTPNLLLPPGTKFNTLTGEIKVVSNAVTSDVIAYEGISNNTKGKGTSSAGIDNKNKTVAAPEAQPSKSGFSMFKKSSTANKTSGIQYLNADVQKQSKELVSSKFELEYEKISSKDFANIWITNPGKLTHGTWTINVLTKDILGGLTVITYTIVIKKSTKITGVLANTGSTKYQTIKTDIKSNYSNILKQSANDLTSKVSSNEALNKELASGSGVKGLNANSSNGKSI